MPPLNNPTDVAREAFRLLAARRIAPTPENYRTIYHEVAGSRPAETPPPSADTLKSLQQELPRETPAQLRLNRELEQAIRDERWTDYRSALARFINEQSTSEGLPWGELINGLLREWDASQAGITPGKKREALAHLFASAGNNAEALYGRLQNLVRTWSQTPRGDDFGLVDAVEAAAGTPARTAAPQAARVTDLVPQMRELLAFALEHAVAAQIVEAPELAGQAVALAAQVRKANSVRAINDLLADLKRFAFRLELLADDRSELRKGLLHLLQLLIENIGELVIDDQWLHGQVALLRDIVSGPLNLRAIDEAEHRIKEVMFKQGKLKHSLDEAREALKTMLAGFIDHLAEFADSTSGYHDKIETCAQKISTAKNIDDLAGVIQEVMNETRIVQLNAQRSRDELQATRRRVQETELRIAELQRELDKASTLVRHDQLTGALNRRGLDETFEKEAARAVRRQTPLCVALLDIDNFKRLNDRLGHDAGDAALIHLSTVIREALRPQDTVVRFGGEEFVILLPDTATDEAQVVLTRLQRELTRRFFLHNNEKLLITFSAGLTELRAGEDQATVLKRADAAMYAAKQAGKNRVMPA